MKNPTPKKTRAARPAPQPETPTPAPARHPLYGKVAPDAELPWIAVLIAEDADGHYEVIGAVSTVREAIEIAEGDCARRRAEIERGGVPMCPEIYRLFAQAPKAGYAVVWEDVPDHLPL
jgi:hypothetical protein